MKRLSGITVLCFLFLSQKSWALFELDTDFMYSRQVYGSERQNKAVTRTYSGSLAMYLFSTTALEVNYSQNQQVIIQNGNTAIQGTNAIITSVQNKVETEVYGLGVRQALLPNRFRIRPLLAFGYARRFTYDSNTYTYTVGSNQVVFNEGPYKRREDSVFASFMLQLKMTQMLALKGSVRTVFPAFETDKAKDYIEYTAGFSWFF